MLYSHRSVSLHSTTVCTADAVGLSSRDRVLAIVPMFHVNAWGLPFAAALTGAELLLPGPHLQGEPLARFVEGERATLVAGVPTVLGALLAHVDEHGGDLSSLRGGICGGSAVPRKLMEGFERHGVRILQAWGMTETSPIVTVARPPAGVDEGEEHWAYRTTQGRMVPWTEIRLSEGAGEIEARGPWVAARYYEDPSGDDKFTDDGWLRTGDIGELDEQGFVRITDRAKDLIKSGGEWISSVEVETLLIDHPAVVEAAVIAMPDEKWGERPLACVALAEGAGVSPGDLREHLSSGLAKWQLPDAFAFIDEVPKTSVGKFDKKVLRRRLAEGELAVETERPTRSASRTREGEEVAHGRARLARAAGDRGHRRLDVGHAHEGESRPRARPGDRLGDEAERPPDPRGLEELVERCADRADARRAGAMLGAHPERAPHRIGLECPSTARRRSRRTRPPRGRPAGGRHGASRSAARAPARAARAPWRRAGARSRRRSRR